MVLPTSGLPISFSEMRSEFGPTQVDNSLSIGSYRISDNIGTLSNLPLDTGVPQFGTIKSSDLHAKRLNVVIDLFSGPPTVRENSRSIYNNARAIPTQQIIPVGPGFKEPSQVPDGGSGSRIIANVNKLIGSENSNRNNVALTTGQWGTNALFEIVIGTSGALYGAGGNGGNGGGPDNGENGGSGSSALGIEYPTTIVSQGVIVAGRGGGGGGGVGGGYEYANVQSCNGDLPQSPRVGGGGGGGGSGFPGGNGGLGNSFCVRRGQFFGPDAPSQNGQNGTLTVGGGGGAGGIGRPGDPACGAQTGTGGAGGSAGNSGLNGTVYVVTSPGLGGLDGYAIIQSANNYILGTAPPVTGDIVTSTVN